MPGGGETGDPAGSGGCRLGRFNPRYGSPDLVPVFIVQLRPADFIYTNFARGRALDFLYTNFRNRAGGDLEKMEIEFIIVF